MWVHVIWHVVVRGVMHARDRALDVVRDRRELIITLRGQRITRVLTRT